MFICSETGISECGTCSGTDRSLRWTGSRNCVYDGACTGNSRSERTGYRVLFFIFLLLVGCAVDVVPFHTDEYEAACDIADGRIIRSGRTVYDYGCIHLCTCRKISIFDYSQIIFATMLGFILFGEIPDKYSFIGYVLIILASLGTFLYNMKAVN